MPLLGAHRYQSQTQSLPQIEETVWDKSNFKRPTWRSWQKKLRRLEKRGVHRCPCALRTTLHACSPRSSYRLWEAGLNICQKASGLVDPLWRMDWLCIGNQIPWTKTCGLLPGESSCCPGDTASGRNQHCPASPVWSRQEYGCGWTSRQDLSLPWS